MPSIFNPKTGKFEEAKGRKKHPLDDVAEAVVYIKGDTPGPEEIRPIVKQEIEPVVKREIGPIVKEQSRRIITEELRKAVAQIPVPKDGKSIDPEEIEEMVYAAVGRIPTPKDGKSVDPQEVRAMVIEAVGRIPTPKDGKSVDPQEVRAMVIEAISKIAAPKDGREIELRKDGDSVQWRYAGELQWNHLFTIPRPGRRSMGGGGAHYLKDLGDVSSNQPSNGQALLYNSTTKRYENGDIAGGSSTPLPGAVTRDGNGYITEIALTGGLTYTFTRDGNNRVATVSDGTYTRTFTRDGNGRIESWTVTP